MHSLFAATALCVAAHAAAANGAVSAPVAGSARPVQAMVQAPAAAAAVPGANKLIKTAAAAPAAAARGQQGGEPPRRTGNAMLFAAVALMAGVALRRLSAGPR